MTTTKTHNVICISDSRVKGEALINFTTKTIRAIELKALPGQIISIEYLENLVNQLKSTLR